MTGPSPSATGQEERAGDACVLADDGFRCTRSDWDHRHGMHSGRPAPAAPEVPADALCPRCRRPLAHHCYTCGNCECGRLMTTPTGQDGEGCTDPTCREPIPHDGEGCPNYTGLAAVAPDIAAGWSGSGRTPADEGDAPQDFVVAMPQSNPRRITGRTPADEG